MMVKPQLPRATVILILAALVPVRAECQRRAPGPETSILVGPSWYDLTGRGTGFAGMASLAFRPVRRGLLLEPSLGYLTYRNDFRQRNHWFFPELSLQAEFQLGNLRPFLGGGAGAGVASLVGSDRWEATLHAVGGLRVALGGTWGVRAEVRLRAVPPWSGHTTDFGFGAVRGIF